MPISGKEEEMKDELGTTSRSEISGNFGAAARPIVTVDVEKYQSYLDGSNMTDRQKEEFLQALWSVMMTFVELGFRVHPLQEVCGKGSGHALPDLSDEFNQVNSDEAKTPGKPKDSGPEMGPEAK
jgi:hypothetical protein